MNINEIKDLISLIDKSTLSYFEFKTENISLKLDKSITRQLNTDFKENSFLNIENKVEEATEVKRENKKNEEIYINKEDKGKKTIESGKIITSPMVGTFYAAPSPDSDPFVSKGIEVKKGTILCIIEAMKLMNEIESEESGTILEVLVKDGDMVEYGTPLFRIEEI